MIICGDALTELRKLDSNSIDCVITSPPYNLKAIRPQVKGGYGIWGTMTAKSVDINYDEYDDNLPEDVYQDWQVAVLDECFRIIKPTGSVFYNHKIRRWGGKTYHPWEFVRESMLNLWQEIIWDRQGSPNVNLKYCLPCTEKIFWLVKGKPKANKNNATHRREVWSIKPSRAEGHPATFPLELPLNCIQLTTDKGDTVLDPFMGSGVTALAAQQLNRKFIGIEISQQYCDLAKERMK